MRNKLIKVLAVAAVILFALTGCSAKTGEVSYANYTKIVLVESATQDTPATTYAGVVILLGAPTSDPSTMVSGTGYAIWESDEYLVRVDFDTNLAVQKSQTGLYESVYKTPIGLKTGVWEWIILQIGTFTYHASNLFGLLGDTYIYAIGLLLMTLVIRTLGWPIYAKSNDMTIKMQLAQPELDKIQQKYAGRSDQASQQRMQMETMELYKKYKINVLGCLMPFLQMPIFIAMYQVVQRFPLTDETIFGGISGVMDGRFFWTNLGNTFVFGELFNSATSAAAWSAFFQNLPLAIIVGATMFLSQWLMTKRQKAQQRPNRYQSAQAQQTAKTMKYMTYFMTFTMAYIALGNAGIAFYWVIGNCYQLLQSEISHRQMLSKKEKFAKNV